MSNTVIKICNGHQCRNNFSKYIFQRAEKEVYRKNNSNILLEQSNCLGMCKKGPIVIVKQKNNEIIYEKADPIKISKIIKNI